jgi:hypothetical protein
METEKADQEAFRAAVAADKKKGVSAKSPYTLGFAGQIRALVVRQFQMRLQDRFQLYTSYSLSIVRPIVWYLALLLNFLLKDPWIFSWCSVLQPAVFVCRRIYPRGVRELRRYTIRVLFLIISPDS